MPDEKVIAEIESIFNDIVELGAASERTRLAPNLLVRNASVSGYPSYILVADDRDGDNILALKVPGVIYNTNDLVNVLFVRGGEAIAFQQGSGSSSSGIWGIVSGTSTDIFYNAGDVGIGKAVAPDARLELLDTAQAQLRLTHTEDTKYATFTLDTNHDLTIDPSSTGQIILGSIDVVIEEDLIHSGDTDTKMTFTDDDITFTVGNLQMLKLTETAQDLITLGAGSGDIDINFNGDMFLQGSDGYFGVGTAAPAVILDVQKSDLTGTDANIPQIRNTNTSSTQGDGATTFNFANFQCYAGNGAVKGFFGARYNSSAALDDSVYIESNATKPITFKISTDRMRLDTSGNLGIGTKSPQGRVHADQESTTAAIPVLVLDQADLSEEFIDFITTVGAGNPIDTAAIGTYYGKARVAVNGTFKYVALYNS